MKYQFPDEAALQKVIIESLAFYGWDVRETRLVVQAMLSLADRTVDSRAANIALALKMHDLGVTPEYQVIVGKFDILGMIAEENDYVVESEKSND